MGTFLRNFFLAKNARLIVDFCYNSAKYEVNTDKMPVFIGPITRAEYELQQLHQRQCERAKEWARKNPEKFKARQAAHAAKIQASRESAAVGFALQRLERDRILAEKAVVLAQEAKAKAERTKLRQEIIWQNHSKRLERRREYYHANVEKIRNYQVEYYRQHLGDPDTEAKNAWYAARKTEHHRQRENAEIAKRGGGCELCHRRGSRELFNWAHKISICGDEAARKRMSSGANDVDWHAEAPLTRYLCLLCHASETALQHFHDWVATCPIYDGYNAPSEQHILAKSAQAISANQILHHIARQTAEITRRGGCCEGCKYAGPRYHFAWAHIIAVCGNKQARADMSFAASDERWHAAVALTRYLCVLCHAVETKQQREAGWPTRKLPNLFDDEDVSDDEQPAPMPTDVCWTSDGDD